MTNNKDPQAAKAQPMQTAKEKIQASVEKPKVSEVKVGELNKAAQLVIDQIPDHAGQLINTLSKQFSIPVWQYTAGILLAVHLEGRLSEFRLDPAWKDGIKTKELICKHCNKPFAPQHIGQPYCSNECGLAATGPEEHIENVPTLPPTPNRASDSITTSNWSDPVESMEAA